METNKLRDVLKKARLFIECSPLKKVEGDFGCIDRDETCAEIDAALAEPVRNCEVGTAEEQAHRFHAFCVSHQSLIKGMCDPTCLCCKQPDKCHCLCKWAQMPYEEGGAK